MTRKCFFVLLFAMWGCSTAPESLRDRMVEAMKPPEGVMQTYLAHIGDLHTEQGTFHVAIQRRVTTGMMAPRGHLGRLALFDTDGELVAMYEHSYHGADPLWCEGSRVYLFGLGGFRDVEVDPRIVALGEDGAGYLGNVLDFSRGPMMPMLTREKKYGSSGGIEDDPWADDG